MVMRLLLYIITSFCFSQWIMAQQPQSPQLTLEIQKAKQAYDIKKYNTAANLYKKLYTKVKNEDQQNEFLFMIAESYRKANNFNQAFDWYEKLVNSKYPDVRIIYSYGLLLKNFERYEDASRQFGDYLFEVPGDPDAIREMEACVKAQQWKASPKKFTINEVKELNTEFSDYSPYYAQGKMIWASSRKESTGNEIFEWTGQKCADFFESTLTNGSWGIVTNLKGKVNSPFNEGAGWLDSSGTTLFYTQCNGMDGLGMNCKLYVTYKQNEEWIAPKVLPFCSDSFSVGHPSMSPDGKKLFFASDMPGGLGNKDIYYVNYTEFNNAWGIPVNLGPNVNTKEDELFPSITADGTLYFSSKGWTGMGGLDLYKTADSLIGFKKAENLQYPINSGGDDFGLSFVPKKEIVSSKNAIGYYTSNRPGGKGDDDIYALYVKPFQFLVSGKVMDKETNLPIASANFLLKDKNDKLIFAINTNENGEYKAELPLDMELHALAQQDKYFAAAPVVIQSTSITADSAMIVNFTLDPIPAEDYEFTLSGIYYDLDKADIRTDAAKVLDSLSTILSLNPSITIELGSHTDSRAPEDYKLKLSQKRAQSCVDYLLKKGISKDRMMAVGYGETKLVNDCADGVECTEEQHQENRRTTFRVLSTEYKRKR